MGDHTKQFNEKVQEYNRLIWYAARRYRIQGVLDPEDLYQEGLIILDKMFREYDFHPDSPDFRKMFKTELWHGLHHVLQRHKAEKRDHRNTVLGEDVSELIESSEGDMWDRPRPETPEQKIFAGLEIERVDEFIETLYQQLDWEAQVVLREIINPRSWEEIPESCRTTKNDEPVWRKFKQIPQHVIANILDWPLIAVRRAIKRIRKTAKLLARDSGFKLLAAVDLNKRKRRAHVGT